MKNQLNVNTLVGAIILAAICFIGKMVMETHDATISIGTNQVTMQGDINGIKAQLPTYAIKVEVEANEKSIWSTIGELQKETQVSRSPKGGL